jgi:excinuclease ABC subunit C
LQKDLHLPSLPLHIECFDNSNLQGTNPVAAMVCFRNGQPSKKDYRHYKIKTVEGIDDFASMKEVVYRRYKRLLEENATIPSLIVIDGGKGQLSAANESIIALGLAGKTTLVGLAKNKEEIFFIGDQESLMLPWKSESLQLIRRIRDEVHRFGLSFHRNQRSQSALPKNELEQIPGIGKGTADVLMKHYKSIKNIRERTPAELAKIVNKTRAEIIITYFKNKKP